MTGCRAMMSRGGNAKRPDDCRPRHRRRFRRYRSHHPCHPGINRCCKSSPPSVLGKRLEETRNVYLFCEIRSNFFVLVFKNKHFYHKHVNKFVKVSVNLCGISKLFLYKTRQCQLKSIRGDRN